MQVCRNVNILKCIYHRKLKISAVIYRILLKSFYLNIVGRPKKQKAVKRLANIFITFKKGIFKDIFKDIYNKLVEI